MAVSFPEAEWRRPIQGTRRYLLLDGAQCVSPDHLLPRLPLTGHVRLFDGLLSDGSADTSVYLGPLADDAETGLLLRRLSGSARYTGCATFIDTALPPEELAQRLRRRLDARLPNGKEFLVRFYDGRVLPLLRDALTASQRAGFFALGQEWWYVAPRLAWDRITLVDAGPDRYSPPLELDDAQRRLLVDGAYPYTLIDHFGLTDPELLERVPPADRYRFLRDCMRAASVHGIRDGRRLVMVATWALLGADLERDPAWQQRLRDFGSGALNARQISDEVWPLEEETWDE